MKDVEAKINRTVRRSLLGVAGMFGFAFALVPLYGLFCDITGLGGRTGGQSNYDVARASIDPSRLVRVSFVANTNDGMAWSFEPEVRVVRVNPGELEEVSFVVHNPTARTIVGQAVPSVTPGRAANYFHKTECFCFSQQVLRPGERKAMPLRFIVGTELPKSLTDIALSYTLYDVTEAHADLVAEADLNEPS